ncbi:class IIb bacteriocin, lactobin A/cerein 7B family [Flavobacterium branchiicola]|uniref:Class IIb bacteriocin, lactobin A/cerein 7B family n=1 Tax=Flavobacterium branchiicola TaxID=1114875 RepID=A0ABV9PB72_9FLAO|nr:class IIb bacteriocin, lactobin A/cerein 7B family [Flavobacterium branchiicola]MBS7254279.1 class IIb bacteriocin, lactobin A/cerein 7B family [Flavobacterium branchiicola]
MLKKILNLNGAQELTKKELKAVNGGVTEACAKALSIGAAILKNGACPPEYPLAGGGCCFAD